jgi:two-component system chemotaxis response regulator CheB
VTDKLSILIAHAAREAREGMARAFAAADDMRVVGASSTCAQALELLSRKRVDMVLLDVELSDALETLDEILRRNAESEPEQDETGVVLIASKEQRYAERVILGLEAGAFDFVRPPIGAQTSVAEDVVPVLMRQLLVKVRHFASKRIFSNFSSSLRPQTTPRPEQARPQLATSKIKAVLIGVSTGGPKVLAALLPELVKAVRLPIFVAQHMPPVFTASLAASLDGRCGRPVVEAGDNELVEERVYIAPGGKHLQLQRGLDRSVRLLVTDAPPDEGCRPSVNLLFESAAKIYGAELAALVLTGMGQDGTRGVRELKKAGAWVVAQDKESSVVWGMPGAAVSSGCVDRILRPDEMAEFLASIAQG